MGFRHSNKKIFQIVMMAGIAAAICFLSIRSVWGGFSSSTAMLAFGFGFTYMLATSFIAIRSMEAVMRFHGVTLLDKLPKTIAVLAVTLVLVVQSSAIFGAYFSIVDNRGFESELNIDWDRHLRQLLKLQIATAPLFALFEARRGRWWDLVIAMFVALIFAAFVLA